MRAKIDNIKRLYKEELKAERTKFLQLVADDLGLSPLTVRNHYFGGFWTIPEKYQDRIINLLQNTIKHQNERITSNSH